ncbi:autotransporter secretion outer membrane protein TamA [Thiohalomonas denitrificans]|uniref:Translocation and assembly module subunit TamA n=2 Tax=Thiohalomonas denitrificans TaxID=415747 RepID=A0A1G5PJ39_9GAMM|nr:autotransporter secretion outer membrane protein TamA [Thiohalomonas denitrificans]
MVRLHPQKLICMQTVGLLLLFVLFAVPGPLPAADAPRLEVEITGIEDPLKSTIRNALSLVREQGHPLLTQYRIQALHQGTPDEIRNTLEPFGYYQAEIEPLLEQRNGTWYARYHVNPGPPVTIGSLDLEIRGPGGSNEVFQNWRQTFPLQPGDRLRHAGYERAKDDLLAIARRYGYFDARLSESRVRVELPQNRADITLHMDTGPRYRFGTVHFSETPLRESLLQRFLHFESGEPFHSGALLELQRALSDSDYFERVDVIPLIEEAEEQRVPIEVRLEIQKRTRYAFGIGYGTDTGPRTTIGIDRRWQNSRGHKAGTRIVASEIRTELNFNYRVPLTPPTTDYLDFTADYTEETTDTSSRETALIGGALTQMRRGWQETLSLNYQEETFDVGIGDERANMLVPGIGWQRVVVDDRLVPQHGWRLAAGLKGASESVLSSTDLAQATFRGSYITTILGGRLITRLEAGASETSNFDRLPVSLRFFAGGDSSVRGYGYQTLGPENSAGDVIGGKHLLIGSVEYDYFWSENWGAAVFIDQGNAFNSTGDFDLSQGAGLGVRYKLPFGLIRVDVASAVSESGNPWRLHINIGPEL